MLVPNQERGTCAQLDFKISVDQRLRALLPAFSMGMLLRVPYACLVTVCSVYNRQLTCL